MSTSWAGELEAIRCQPPGVTAVRMPEIPEFIPELSTIWTGSRILLTKKIN